jgi:hypothetical protein
MGARGCGFIRVNQPLKGLTMKKLDEIFDSGKGLAFYLLAAGLGLAFYGSIWLMLAIGTILGG